MIRGLFVAICVLLVGLLIGNLDPFEAKNARSQNAPASERVKLLAVDPKRKIEAIRVYRQETGAGLKVAKDVVEAWVSSQHR